MYEDIDDEYEYENPSRTVRFTEKEFDEIVSLAKDCGLSVRQLILYRLFGYIEN